MHGGRGQQRVVLDALLGVIVAQFGKEGLQNREVQFLQTISSIICGYTDCIFPYMAVDIQHNGVRVLSVPQGGEK